MLTTWLCKSKIFRCHDYASNLTFFQAIWQCYPIYILVNKTCFFSCFSQLEGATCCITLSKHLKYICCFIFIILLQAPYATSIPCKSTLHVQTHTHQYFCAFFINYKKKVYLIVEEMDGMFVQLQGQSLQKWNIICHNLKEMPHSVLCSS